eukprot:scaffold258408_cov31-Tisochrysis_lutea.AAC.2
MAGAVVLEWPSAIVKNVRDVGHSAVVPLALEDVLALSDQVGDTLRFSFAPLRLTFLGGEGLRAGEPRSTDAGVFAPVERLAHKTPLAHNWWVACQLGGEERADRIVNRNVHA